MSYRRHEHLSGRSRKIAYRQGILRAIEKRLDRLAAATWPRAPRSFDKLDPRRRALVLEVEQLVGRL
jgi:hypothetical protein